MDPIINIAYLVASALFIFGLKLLGSPRSAPLGNQLAAVGMLIAIAGAMARAENYGLVIAGIALGSALGIWSALVVKMTAMPQMVALFNGFGGAASALVATSEISDYTADPGAAITVPVALSILIGQVTFTGSMIAFAKLQELMSGRPLVYPLQKTLNLIIGLLCAALGAMVVLRPLSPSWYLVLFGISSVLGVLLVLPIGGADMPVVISLLNSYSGLAACATGFVLQDNVLIIGGSLVGASGIILTQIMCKAMNRSLANVLFGAFGQAPASGAATAAAGGSVKSASPDEAAMILDGASLVIFVPGYGMAVAQAQHQVRELAKLLEKKGTEVKYAIHPVAGRMPGHMNVLLAEADVPYDQLVEMDSINPRFPQADVAMVIGANDVTNPAARSNPASPLFGMPILDVDRARSVMILKRSMNPGFAGVDNELFTRDNAMMIFGDAKETLTRLIAAVKELN